MSDIARVTALDALTDFRTALSIFKQEAQDALGAIDLEIRRSQDWLDIQQNHWHREIVAREDEVTQAKAELARRKMFYIFDQPPDCSEQEKALRRALRRLEEAQDKKECCRRWRPALQRAIEEYEGHSRQVAELVETDLPRALALLARMSSALDAYVDLTAGAPPPRASAVDQILSDQKKEQTS